MTKSKRKEIPSRFQFWPLLSLAAIAGLIYAFFIVPTLLSKDLPLDIVHYQWLLWQYSFTKTFLEGLIMLAFLITAHGVAIHMIVKLRHKWAKIFMGILYFPFFVGFSCVLLFTLLLYLGFSYDMQHIGTVEFEGSTFHLARVTDADFEFTDQVLLLYKCENDKRNCQQFDRLYIDHYEYFDHITDNFALRHDEGNNRLEIWIDDEVFARYDADFVQDTSVQNLTTPITAENISQIQHIFTVYHAGNSPLLYWSSQETLLLEGYFYRSSISFADAGLTLEPIQNKRSYPESTQPDVYEEQPDNLEYCERLEYPRVLSHETNLLLTECRFNDVTLVNAYDATTLDFITTVPMQHGRDIAFRPDDAVIAISTSDGIQFYGIP